MLKKMEKCNGDFSVKGLDTGIQERIAVAKFYAHSVAQLAGRGIGVGCL